MIWDYIATWWQAVTLKSKKQSNESDDESDSDPPTVFNNFKTIINNISDNIDGWPDGFTNFNFDLLGTLNEHTFKYAWESMKPVLLEGLEHVNFKTTVDSLLANENIHGVFQALFDKIETVIDDKAQHILERFMGGLINLGAGQ